jgi:TonB family protein
MATQPSDSAKQRPRSSPADELAVIAQRAQAFTNASGAAIALSEGVENEIVCRARSGSSAPDIGTSLRVEGTFTGLCIQSGKELRCDDAETDTRVDNTAIRALGIRSMVVTPIKEDAKVIGVLAVFAPTPHAFTITHVAVLKTMADQIGTLLQKERRAREEGALHPEPPVAMPKPVAAAPVPPAPAPVVIKPSTSSAAAAAAPARSSSVPAPKVEPIRPVPVAEVAPPVPFPKKEEKRAEPKIEPKPEPRPEPKSESIARASFGTLDAVSAEEKKAGGNKLVLFAIVAVVVVAAAGAGFKFLRKSPSASQPATQTAQNTAPAASVPATVTNPPSATTVADNSAAQPPVGSSPASKPATDKTDTKADSKKTDQPRNSNNSNNSSNTQTAAQTRPVPTPATVALDNGPSRISTRDTQQPQNAPEVAPSLAVGGGSTSATLSSLAKPANTTAPTALKQSEFVPLSITHKESPIYPPLARPRRVSGSVMVHLTVGKDGKATNLQFVSGNPIFRDAAFEAVKKTQFKPAMLNGQPTEQPFDIKYDFHAPN